MTRGLAARAAGALLGALVLVGLAASPASADPPRPTNYRSTVRAVDPALPAGVEVRVVGGDSLLELAVPPGLTAVVADYPTAAGETESSVPYLRFEADGTVRRNVLAVATTANDSRYGTTDQVPDPEADPRWETVATNGTYAWHDHRIHWMSPSTPRAVADDGQVDLGGPDGTWSVPITIDGTPTVITGTLVLVDPPSILPSLVVFVASLAVALVVARSCLRRGSIAGIVASTGAVVGAVATWRAIPADAGGSAVPVIVAAVALLAAWAGVLGPDRARLVAVAACAAALLGWGATRFAVLDHAVLPSTLAPWLDRSVTAAALGVGLGLAVALVWRPAPSRPAGSAATASPTA